MNKELQEIAIKIARLEKELEKGSEKETEKEIMEIISKLSLGEILEIDNYILEKNFEL